MTLHPLRKDPDQVPTRPAGPAALPVITMTAPRQALRREVPPATDSGAAPDKAPEPAKDKSKLASLLAGVVGVSLALVIVAPVTLSAQHLIEWAHSPTGLGLPVYFAWVVFLALDLAAVTCIGMVTLCAKRGESAGGFSIATWAFALASAFANYSGGTGAGKWFFPAMSLAGPTLLEMVLGKVKAWARISEGTQMSARPKFGVRWVPGIAFRETSKAWAAARRENIAKTADAIAFVREADLLEQMNDTDAVRYAQAAARTTDPHELRQWLTSRGKNVAQAALPMLPAAPTVTAEQIVEPTPEPVRALPAAAWAAIEKPSPRPRPRVVKDKDDKPVQIRRKRPQDHPRWADAEAAYRTSIEKGAKFSQRKLADTLNIHRNLAKAVIDHVDDELFPTEG
jgi:hypothetical protein